jgi:hypothetical protein
MSENLTDVNVKLLHKAQFINPETIRAIFSTREIYKRKNENLRHSMSMTFKWHRNIITYTHINNTFILTKISLSFFFFQHLIISKACFCVRMCCIDWSIIRVHWPMLKTPSKVVQRLTRWVPLNILLLCEATRIRRGMRQVAMREWEWNDE